MGGKTGIHIKIDHYLTELDSQCLGRCIYKTITSIIAKEKDALWPMWMVSVVINSAMYAVDFA